MLKFILILVGLILLTIVLVKLIDKFFPAKLRGLLNIVLWAGIGIAGYFTFMSVYGVIEFNKLKTERYQVVIDRLIDIRDAQVAHKAVTGKFTSTFDSLIRFVDTAKVPITQRRDSTIKDIEKTKRYGVDAFTSIVIVDTLNYYSVKDSLFQKTDRYKNMADVGIGEAGARFKMEAGYLEDIPVFQASVDKGVILFDQNKNWVDNEKEIVSVDGITGPILKVGSMEEITTAGNWSKSFDNKE